MSTSLIICLDERQEFSYRIQSQDFEQWLAEDWSELALQWIEPDNAPTVLNFEGETNQGRIDGRFFPDSSFVSFNFNSMAPELIFGFAVWLRHKIPLQYPMVCCDTSACNLINIEPDVTGDELLELYLQSPND